MKNIIYTLTVSFFTYSCVSQIIKDGNYFKDDKEIIDLYLNTYFDSRPALAKRNNYYVVKESEFRLNENFLGLIDSKMNQYCKYEIICDSNDHEKQILESGPCLR